jgi:hypothetical protein
MEYKYSLYLVALVDVLGQRQKVKQLTLPQEDTPEERAKLIAKLKETAGVILRIRKEFYESFEIMNTPGPFVANLPEPERNNLIKLNRCQLELFGFSDSITISIPLTAENEFYSAILGINACLISLCSSMLNALGHGHPIRGGVDIGPCITMGSKNEVYGSALESAYYLESKVAQFPRIVVGKSLFDFVCALENMKGETRLGNLTNLFASKAKRLIGQDSQNVYYLDYLSDEYISTADYQISETIFEIMENLVNINLAAFNGKDEKLYSRYLRLKEYVQLKKQMHNKNHQRMSP